MPTKPEKTDAPTIVGGADRSELRGTADDCKQALSHHDLPRCHKRGGELTDLKATGSARFWR